MSNLGTVEKAYHESVMTHFENKTNATFSERIEALIHEFLSTDRITSELNNDELNKIFSQVSIPEEGLEESDYLQGMTEHVIGHTINTGSPYFIGHMTTLLPSFMRPISKLIATMNQNVVKVETSKSLTFYEKQALAMLHKAVYNQNDDYYKTVLSDHSSPLGLITSGGTLANIAALQCARNHSLAPFADIEQEGFFAALNKAGFTQSVVIGSSLAHYSIEKSMGLLGLGKQNLLSIPVDKNQKIDLMALRETLVNCANQRIHVSAIVGVAGSTECGSFDPLSEMADLAEEFGVYFHVDAAWGGPLVFSDQHRNLLSGVERADSVTIDGHKQLYLPMGIGIVLFKNHETGRLITNEANYIIRAASPDLGRMGVEGSRPANVCYLQAALCLIGKKGYAHLLDNSIKTAHQMASDIQSSLDFELLNEPQANIFLYRFIPEAYRGLTQYSVDDNQEIDRYNIQLQELQLSRGATFVSRTLFKIDSEQSVVGLRVVIANPLTTVMHCRAVLEDQRNIVRSLESSQA
ncbi:aminotransferase class V-fold PLP-dependent enzyme [Marinomonas sp. 2405UD68-3]|uniref:aminotransferase class V-fold PLP-dependent enzyme n=1 Tax=Marinomonas sp. 2405UD68-3 TaxID=3391835 RepID=UPI0039C93CFE